MSGSKGRESYHRRRLQVAHQQLHAAPAAPVVQVQLVGQAQASGPRLTGPAAEMDGRQHRPTGTVAQPQAKVAAADLAGLEHLELAVEYRLGKTLAPGPGQAQLFGHGATDLVRRQLAVRPEFAQALLLAQA